ncbi:unnamed protein product [Closterium sp. Naga37s-1]|nr:unnamed protein product [Closterium sp. Naga37s-1]
MAGELTTTASLDPSLSPSPPSLHSPSCKSLTTLSSLSVIPNAPSLNPLTISFLSLPLLPLTPSPSSHSHCFLSLPLLPLTPSPSSLSLSLVSLPLLPLTPPSSHSLSSLSLPLHYPYLITLSASRSWLHHHVPLLRRTLKRSYLLFITPSIAPSFLASLPRLQLM